MMRCVLVAVRVGVKRLYRHFITKTQKSDHAHRIVSLNNIQRRSITDYKECVEYDWPPGLGTKAI